MSHYVESKVWSAARLRVFSVAIFIGSLFAKESTCSAQLTDVFSSAFKSVAGFDAWMAWPSYTANGNNAIIPQEFGVRSQKVFAYSIKFAPLNFGGVDHDPTKDKLKFLFVYYRQLGASTSYTAEFDTVRTDRTGTYLSTCSYVAVVNFPGGTLVPAGVPPTSVNATYGNAAVPPPPAPRTPPVPTAPAIPSAIIDLGVEINSVPAHHLSLSLGYSFASNFDYRDNSGFTTSFPISGIFLEAITPLKGWGPDNESSLSLVFGASIPTLTNIRAISVSAAGDTTRLKVNSPVSFAPDIGLGYAYKITDGFYFFADLSYKFQVFSGLDYTPALQGGTITPTTLDILPKEIDASNLRVKLGFSFNVAS